VIESIMENVIGAVTAYGPNLLGALLILVLGWIAARTATGLLRRALRRAKVDDTLVRFIGSVVYVALMVMVVIAVLERLGVNTTSFAAVVAAAGLAIGLAFQGSLSNLSAGVLLILFRPFKAGDYIEAGGVAGTVQEIEIFVTVLNTPDNRRIIVPNGDVIGGSIVNYSANDSRRVDMVFGIAYEDDVARAREIVEQVLARDERVLADPAPTVALLELADSSVNLAVRPWVKSADYWAVFFDLNEKVKAAFDAASITIPFPQRDVHVKGSDGEARAA
jgi:small conductance mechanosensitive channel